MCVWWWKERDGGYVSLCPTVCVGRSGEGEAGWSEVAPSDFLLLFQFLFVSDGDWICGSPHRRAHAHTHTHTASFVFPTSTCPFSIVQFPSSLSHHFISSSSSFFAVTPWSLIVMFMHKAKVGIQEGSGVFVSVQSSKVRLCEQFVQCKGQRLAFNSPLLVVSSTMEIIWALLTWVDL